MGKLVNSNVSVHRLIFVRVNLYIQCDKCIWSFGLLSKDLSRHLPGQN